MKTSFFIIVMLISTSYCLPAQNNSQLNIAIGGVNYTFGDKPGIRCGVAYDHKLNTSFSLFSKLSVGWSNHKSLFVTLSELSYNNPTFIYVGPDNLPPYASGNLKQGIWMRAEAAQASTFTTDFQIGGNYNGLIKNSKSTISFSLFALLSYYDFKDYVSAFQTEISHRSQPNPVEVTILTPMYMTFLDIGVGTRIKYAYRLGPKVSLNSQAYWNMLLATRYDYFGLELGVGIDI